MRLSLHRDKTEHPVKHLAVKILASLVHLPQLTWGKLMKSALLVGQVQSSKSISSLLPPSPLKDLEA